MVENRNCEILFAYLKSILNDAQIREITVETLDEPYRDLGRELILLQRSMEELAEFSEDFAAGGPSGRYPAEGSFACGNFRRIRDNFSSRPHMSGSSGGNASCPGVFSESFIEMASRRRGRELPAEKHAAKEEQEYLTLIESYNDLLVTLTRQKDEWIIVIDDGTREIVYCNKHIDRRGSDGKLCGDCRQRLSFHQRLLEWRGDLDERIWEANGTDGRIYRVITFPVEWRGRDAWAHVVSDITADRQAEQNMEMKAYHDAGTGIYNRLYFMEHMQKMLGQDGGFTLCYLDLDDLKYVNDHFGHNEGDEYIRQFVATIRHRFRSTDIFARVGGDEFCLILPDCSIEFAVAKLESARHSFCRGSGKDYPRGFSYGAAEVKREEDRPSLDELIRLADNRMYEYKRKTKAAAENENND